MSPRAKKVKSTRIRILDGAEEYLRLHGPEELTIVAVAERLNMSHANVYKYFNNKAELQQEVVERWLEEITKPLKKICEAKDEPAAGRVRSWLHELARIRSEKMRSDPGLFRAFLEHPEPERDAAEGHYEEMIQQVAEILWQGEMNNEWQKQAFDAEAKALLDASAVYLHPYFLMYAPKEPWEMDSLLDWFILALQAEK